jgi:hypothetical protein
MIRIRISLLAVLLVAALPAWAMFGFLSPDSYSHEMPGPWIGQQVLVEDVNQDGLDDVLLTVDDVNAPGTGKISLATFLQTEDTHKLSAPVFHPVSLPNWKPYALSSIAKGDVNRDGVDDVVVGHDYGATILDPANGLAILSTIDRRDEYDDPKIARVGDVDGDGNPDIAMLVASVGRLSHLLVYRGNGAGGFDNGTDMTLPDTCCYRDVRIVDLNKDGRQDLLLYSEAAFNWSGPPGFSVYYNRGAGTFDPKPLILVSSSGTSGSIAVGDVDNDGWPDLAAWNSDPSVPWTGALASARVYFHGRASPYYRGFKSWTTDWKTPGATLVQDMDGNGKQDFLFSQDTGYGYSEYPYTFCFINYVPFSGKYAYRYLSPCARNGDGQDTGDINGDGVTDVVIASRPFGLGWNLGTNSPEINNVVVGEGTSPGTVAFNIKNASVSMVATDAAVEITLAVNHGNIEVTDWPEQCYWNGAPEPIVCDFQDLAPGASASGIVHYAVTKSVPMMRLTATARAYTTAMETVVADNTVIVTPWIRQL